MGFCKDFETLQFFETAWKKFAGTLAGCCDLSQLASTGLLAPAEGFQRIQDLQSVLAPLLVKVGWERSKVKAK